MKSSFHLPILLLGLSLGVGSYSGCHHRHKGDWELLERDLRWQEIEIDNLAADIQEYKHRLEACRRENEALKRERDGLSSDLPSRSRSTSPSRGSNPPEPSTPPSIQFPGSSPSTPSSPPLISPPGQMPEGEPATTGEYILPGPASTSTGARTEAPRFETAPLFPSPEGGTPAREVKSTSPGNDETTSTHEVTSKEVDRITLNKFLTGGHNPDAKGGDDGIMVLVEPRNQRGDLLQAPGEVSIVVLDPALQGAEARVARWDYTTDETAVRYQKTGIQPGFLFEARWPNRPPANRTVDLHVRFTTVDGRKLEASKRIDLDAVLAEEREGAEQAKKGEWNRSTSPSRATRLSENLAPRWPAGGIPTQPIETQPIPAPATAPAVESIARPIEPAPSPAKPPAGKPGWSPYR